MARCTSAAATAESTPPDSPQIARPDSPTCARIRATCSSTMDAIVHEGRRPAMSCRNRRSTSWPCGECATSGWYCTPASRRAVSSNAATGAPADPAVTVNPGGAAVTLSPCDIHTGCRAGRSACSTPPAAPSSVRPNSRVPVCATSPPSAWAIAWKP